MSFSKVVSGIFSASLQKKRIYFALYCLYFMFGYGLTNQYQIFRPKHLPMTMVDYAIPLIPWTVWIYLSQYVFFFVGIAFLKHVALLRKLMIAFFFCFTVSFLIFFFFPTTCPRELLLAQSLSEKMLHAVWKIDAPFNCFPSLHVSLPFLMAFFFYEISRKHAILLTIWSALIAFSTMTTSQHYFADVLGGLFLASVFVPLVSYFYSKLQAEGI